MSENPVRKASEKAAKEIWVLKNTSSVPSEIQSQMADIIESKFAPVVAAAEETMKDKCAKVLCSRCAKNIPVEHLDISCNGAWMWIHREREPGWPEFNKCDADKIRAIPTGTALAEKEELCGTAVSADISITEKPQDTIAKAAESFDGPRVAPRGRSDFSSPEEWMKHLDSLVNKPEADVLVLSDGRCVSLKEPAMAEYVERAVKAEREKWTMFSGRGVTLDMAEIIKGAVERATAELRAELLTIIELAGVTLAEEEISCRMKHVETFKVLSKLRAALSTPAKEGEK